MDLLIESSINPEFSMQMFKSQSVTKPHACAFNFNPEYFESPMVIIDNWDTLVETMIRLERNQTALLERQIQLREWYYHFMHSKITEMEDAIASSIESNNARNTKPQ